MLKRRLPLCSLGLYALIAFMGFEAFALDPNALQSEPNRITSAINHPDRSPEDKARDAGRNPSVILEFMGVKAGDKVADLGTGTGYYAELLARVVGSNGTVYAVNNDFVSAQIGNDGIIKKSRIRGLNNIRFTQQELDKLRFAEPLDAVFFMLFYHDAIWQETDRVKMNKAIFNALKPGGILAITDHRAEIGSGERDSRTLHRTDEALVRREVEAAGFQFLGQSNALSTSDDRNNVSVFAPSVRGKTSRFVYKFQKPIEMQKPKEKP